MAPNALSGAIQVSSSSSCSLALPSAEPPKSQQQMPLRRSTTAFGGAGVFTALCAAAATSASFEMFPPRGNQQRAMICPAPVNQVELKFTLSPSSSSIVLIDIRAPSGDCAKLRLSTAQTTGSFCARQSHGCGHGQWSIRIEEEEEGKRNGNGHEMIVIPLDGVGSLHYLVHSPRGQQQQRRTLELMEQEFLKVAGVAAHCQMGKIHKS